MDEADVADAGLGRSRRVAPPRVTVVVRSHCPTCDRMEDVVRRICAETGTAWSSVDVDAPGTDPDLRGEFADVVPVTLVDGREHASWSVDPAALRAALAR